MLIAAVNFYSKPRPSAVRLERVLPLPAFIKANKLEIRISKLEIIF